jgi:hypothetical protein
MGGKIGEATFGEQIMKNRTLLIAWGIGVFATAVLLTGAEPAAVGPAQWEYGMYIESPGNFEWHTAATHIRGTNANFFFERMGFPTDIEVSARTGRVQPLLLNYLGQQGWELVEAAIDSGRSTYWFKRPR